MMPPPEEVAAFVDRAEGMAIAGESAIGRYRSEDRRRLIAWAVFDELRHHRQDQRELVPVSGR